MKRIAIILSGLILFPLLFGCSGVSQTEYNQLQHEYNILFQELITEKETNIELQKQINDLEDSNNELQEMYDDCDLYYSEILSKYPPKRFANYEELENWRSIVGNFHNATLTDDCEQLQYTAALNGYFVSMWKYENDDWPYCAAITEDGGLYIFNPWNDDIDTISEAGTFYPVTLFNKYKE